MLKELQLYCGLCLGLITAVCGYGRFRTQIPNGMNVSHPCTREIWSAVGHAQPYHVREKNVFGMDWRSNNFNWAAVCRLDSDGDGLTNGQELGDPNCVWSFGQTPMAYPEGHPGFCEPHRRKCDRGTNICGGGRGIMRTPPPEANDHPQSFLSKQLGGIMPGRMGPGFPRGPTRIRIPATSFRGSQSIFGPAPRQTMVGMGGRPQMPGGQFPRMPVSQGWDPRSGSSGDMWGRSSMSQSGMSPLQRQVQDRMQRVRIRMQPPQTQMSQPGPDFFSSFGRGSMSGVSGVSGITGFGPSGFR